MRFTGRLIDECPVDDPDNQLSCDAHRVSTALTRLAQLRADHTEFACLKALLLFKPGTKFLGFLFDEITHLFLEFHYCVFNISTSRGPLHSVFYSTTQPSCWYPYFTI